jgi:hypothetical protein
MQCSDRREADFTAPAKSGPAGVTELIRRRLPESRGSHRKKLPLQKLSARRRSAVMN